MGYQYDINEYFRLVPRIGFNWRELEGQEGIFLNPASRATSLLDDNDIFWRIDFDFLESENFSPQLNDSDINLEVGSVEATSLGVRDGF